jgi:lipoic acid synthetase
VRAGGCRFCNVKTSRAPPLPADDEPEKTAEAIASWAVDYVVITSVDRDDIFDGGAEHYARVVRRVKELKPEMRLECLTPDFNGTSGLAGVATVATAGLDVYAHNIETVERLQSVVRDRRAGYRESIGVLEHAKKVNPRVVTKTSIMLGLGEEAHEIRQTMRDMRDAGVEIFTLGQYLRPSKRHMKVARMLPPEEYDGWREEGMAMGFKYVASGPLVRSSYKAGEVFMSAILEQRDAEEKAVGGAAGAGAAEPEASSLPRSAVWTPPSQGAMAASSGDRA